ncbi:MAG: hypothetical protein KME20_15270 [Kaiparowitsia implicata GSE-PSE-MK54-09C]|jgi:hypothetical protein|nr:hypothetical protein [Kaiparowitsia implicata GSE-PSE-MK54-09C]
MLAHLLALLVGLGGFALYMSAFFFPEVHRKNDFVWSGFTLFYAWVLWVCAGRITGGVLLGQVASVTLLGWLGWQTLQMRRSLTPYDQQTWVSGSKSLGETLLDNASDTWAKLQQQVERLPLPAPIRQLPQQATRVVTTLQQRTQKTVGKTKPPLRRGPLAPPPAGQPVQPPDNTPAESPVPESGVQESPNPPAAAQSVAESIAEAVSEAADPAAGGSSDADLTAQGFSAAGEQSMAGAVSTLMSHETVQSPEGSSDVVAATAQPEPLPTEPLTHDLTHEAHSTERLNPQDSDSPIDASPPVSLSGAGRTASPVGLPVSTPEMSDRPSFSLQPDSPAPGPAPTQDAIAAPSSPQHPKEREEPNADADDESESIFELEPDDPVYAIDDITGQPIDLIPDELSLDERPAASEPPASPSALHDAGASAANATSPTDAPEPDPGQWLADLATLADTMTDSVSADLAEAFNPANPLESSSAVAPVDVPQDFPVDLPEDSPEVAEPADLWAEGDRNPDREDPRPSQD